MVSCLAPVLSPFELIQWAPGSAGRGGGGASPSRTAEVRLRLGAARGVRTAFLCSFWEPQISGLGSVWYTPGQAAWGP